MKTIAIAFIAGMAVVGGIAYNYGWFTNEINYTNEQDVKVIDNTPEWAKDEDAAKAARDVIRRKELEAELSQLESEVTERQTRISEIEKELGTY